MTWQEVRDRKVAQVNGQIPSEWRIEPELLARAPATAPVIDWPFEMGLITAEEKRLTELHITELAPMLARGELLNCNVEMFFDTALRDAAEADSYLKKTGRTTGPLHGVPISLKDQFRVRDVETAMAYISWLGHKELPEEESVLVECLRQVGAILYVKTNVPQTLMVTETFNNLMGTTCNPFNRTLTCGGSSGGEGALVGAHGSPAGFGTDIGGSIRVPAAYQGLFGIRPSHGRLPYAKAANSMEGQETVHSVCGPMAHSAADVEYVVKSVLEARPWRLDPKVIELPWREEAAREVAARPLTLGVLMTDGVVTPVAPVKRALDETVQSLRRNGHTVVEWSGFDHGKAVDIINAVYSADGGADTQHDIEASGEPAISTLVPPGAKMASATEIWDLQLEKYKYQQWYLRKWNALEQELGCNVDGFIMPVACYPPHPHQQLKYVGYTSAINLLDFTSGG